MQKKKGCQLCYKIDTISFNKEYYEKEYEYCFQELYSGLGIYQCEKCHTVFKDKNGMYEKVNDTYIAYLKHWESLSFELFYQFNEIIQKIQPIKVDANTWELPCKIVLQNDEVIDFCTLQFSSSHPAPYIQSTYDKVFFSDEIKEIKESEYALSYAVRKASMEAPEIRMCYSPLSLVNDQHQHVLVNGPSLFFYKNGIKGSTLSVAENAFATDKEYVATMAATSKTIVLIRCDDF